MTWLEGRLTRRDRPLERLSGASAKKTAAMPHPAVKGSTSSKFILLKGFRGRKWSGRSMIQCGDPGQRRGSLAALTCAEGQFSPQQLSESAIKAERWQKTSSGHPSPDGFSSALVYLWNWPDLLYLKSIQCIWEFGPTSPTGNWGIH